MSTDAASAIHALTTLRAQFVDASSKWPDVKHTLVVLLDTPRATDQWQKRLEQSPRTLTKRDIGIFAEAEFNLAIDSDGNARREGVPAIKMESTFRELGDPPIGRFRGTARFLALAEPAWKALVQLPESIWELFNLPNGESPDSLVGRTWLSRYRQSVDRDKSLAHLERLKVSGVDIDSGHFYVPEKSGHEIRGLAHKVPPALLWLIALYNLGWRNESGAFLAVERHTWSEAHGDFVFRQRESELDLFRKQPIFNLPIDIPKPIEWFESELSDPLMASVWAIDGLLEAARRDQCASVEPKTERLIEIGSSNTPSETGLSASDIELKKIEEMPKAVRLAWLSAQRAISVEPSLGDKTDGEVYEWISVHAEDDYELPDNPETWRRYLREARRFLKQQKNQRRAGRTGKSILSRDETG
jgi:hypothetical protein